MPSDSSDGCLATPPPILRSSLPRQKSGDVSAISPLHGTVSSSQMSTVEGGVCPICLDPLVGTEDDSIASISSCDHHFHTRCIATWATRKNTCPLCGRLFFSISDDHGPVSFESTSDEDDNTAPKVLPARSEIIGLAPSDANYSRGASSIDGGQSLLNGINDKKLCKMIDKLVHGIQPHHRTRAHRTHHSRSRKSSDNVLVEIPSRQKDQSGISAQKQAQTKRVDEIDHLSEIESVRVITPNISGQVGSWSPMIAKKRKRCFSDSE